jgi:MoxR-like ATPase
MEAAKNNSSLAQAKVSLRRFIEALKVFAGGRDDFVEIAVSALFSEGHVLIEDVPGVGKTTFIKALAKLCGLGSSRIQCTSDLLPSDVIGVQVYDESERQFRFHKGPIFTDILLADELNRASPRTQSALLEAMGEGHVTVDRATMPLPRPFIVFAAQNPKDSVGTYALPESQLDRFAVRLHMGYPDADYELQLFRDAKKDPLASLPSDVMSREQILLLMEHLRTIHISASVALYVKRVIDRSRATEGILTGVSTRGGLTWMRLAAGFAIIQGRDYVIPDDLQKVGVAALAHRIVTRLSGGGEDAIKTLLATSPVV